MYLINLDSAVQLPNFNVRFCEVLFNDHSLGDSSIIDLTKNKIGQIDQDIWSRFRKYSNIYEQPKIKNYTKIKPISRAYYKLWEILHDFNISCETDTFHIAESPGGFIEAVLEYKKRKYFRSGICYTVSLQEEAGSAPGFKDIPKYNKRILKNKLVSILAGEGRCNGDVCVVKNILYLHSILKTVDIKFITADGGINDNGDYNNKEISHIRLILCEVFLALLVLGNDGVFVLKIFDILTKPTSDIIFLLSYLFTSVSIFKPLTSRNTNSEKYLVCQGFKKNLFSTEIKNNIFKIIITLENEVWFLKSIFAPLPRQFINLINTINSKFMNQQKISIEKTLDFIQRFNKKSESGDIVIKTKYFSDVVIYDFEVKKEDLIRKWLNKYQLTAR